MSKHAKNLALKRAEQILGSLYRVTPSSAVCVSTSKRGRARQTAQHKGVMHASGKQPMSSRKAETTCADVTHC